MKVYILFLVFLCGLSQSHAQTEKKTADKKAKFLPLPYVNYSRNLKFEGGLMPMVMFPLSKKDTISPNSMAGALIAFTTNGSSFTFAFSRLFFKEDRWRASFFLGTGDQNSQTYMEGIDIPPGLYDFATSFKVAHAGLQRRIYHSLYGGVAYTHTVAQTVFEDEVSDPTDNTNNGISLILLSDTRKNIYYPGAGYLMRFKWINYPEWLSNDAPANKINLEFNRYLGMSNNRDILALRGTVQAGLGSIDFEQQEVIGQKDIRGYSLGEFRGDGKFALQGEYRKNFANSRIGWVGFLGLATLYGSLEESQNWRLYPGIGTGFRFTAFEKSHMNIGLDAAVGDGDWGIYFRIGEAF
ncbi:hypothetical protein E7Z59_05230 [Robertkochia marina]|uniref:Bacterial surface antigen (D15) domain-containing protein n=1 Tax=Robertkochia marina TaxID=1227945 RepID=A0A4S3M3I2_9FLAO|nr:hypothetical protein [Robertkochia marina]THD69732.1 hypothetical protein E7Z59_05230 [Robertkochia marina]TRZ46925.1 hypothetical protein D3A96_04985 [Robertkochia marina]